MQQVPSIIINFNPASNGVGMSFDSETIKAWPMCAAVLKAAQYLEPKSSELAKHSVEIHFDPATFCLGALMPPGCEHPRIAYAIILELAQQCADFNVQKLQAAGIQRQAIQAMENQVIASQIQKKQLIH